MFAIFKRKKTVHIPVREIIEDRSRKARSQQAVYMALVQLNRPVSGSMVARHLGWDSASVTNRLAELCKKGAIKVDYRKKGLDGRWRNFYAVGRER